MDFSTKRITFEEMKKLFPIGIQDFRSLIEGGYLYIDKTEDIYRLISEGKYYFLSRPRRFGKSLMVSILKEFFRGSKELFEGLWIHDKIDTEPRPVIHLDFSAIVSASNPLGESISYALDEIAAEYGVTLPEKSYDYKFSALIRELGKDKKVAILIDEYDKPIVEHIDQPENAQENRKVLRSFYSVVKGSDEFIDFFLLTGIAKFTKVSIFSDLNNLEDISFDENFGELLGYSQSELVSYFNKDIEALGEKYNSVYPDILEAIKRWYNGYSWDGKHFVYNPFSILNLFKKQLFESYWFSTGTPTFLIKLFHSRNYNLVDFQDYPLSTVELNSFDIETLELPILLLQTGYLTVKEYDIFKRILILGFPNKEVEYAFSMNLLKELGSSKNTAHTRELNRLEKAFNEGDLDKAIELLISIFANIAYPLHPDQKDSIENKERFYHSIFLTVLKLLGFRIEPEVLTSNGRIDAVIHTEKYLYIIEFKVGEAKAALAQIQEKQYHQKYLPTDKEIILVGIGFDPQQKNINGFKTLALKSS